MKENVKTEKNKTIIKERITELENLKETLKTYLGYVEDFERKTKKSGNKK
jgi:hypothetical protein